jgi:hypothetical protein
MITTTNLSARPRQPHYIAMASRLLLKRFRSIPSFLRATLRIRTQLADTSGLVGYALNAQLTRKTFWTVSVCQDRASLDAFARSQPHRSIMERLQPHMDESRFEFFAVSGTDLPIGLSDAMSRLRQPPLR